MSIVLCVAVGLGATIEKAAAKENKPKPPFRTARGISHALQKYSGINWLTNTVASGVTSAALSVKTGSLVKAKVRTYNFTDLLDGEFESVDVKVNGGKFDGMPLGKLHVSTTNPFKMRYFQRKGHNSGLRTPLMVTLEGDVAEKDISKALNSKEVTSQLRFLKLDLPGLGEQHLQVLNPKVELVGDKIKVNSWLVTAGAPHDTGIPLEVVASPRLKDDRLIMLDDLQVKSSEIIEPEKFSQFAADLLNPLVDFGRMDRFTHAIRFQKIDIENERVTFAGRLLLAPKRTKVPTFSAPYHLGEEQKAVGQGVEAAAAVNRCF